MGGRFGEIIDVDLTWAVPEVGCPKMVGGGGGVKPYNQTSAWDGAPTVLQCFTICLFRT